MSPNGLCLTNKIYVGVWGCYMGPFLQFDIDKIEKVQRKAARFIGGDSNPETVAASLECSRTLDYRFLNWGESNRASRICSRWLRGWCQLYQPPTILNQFKINVKYVPHVIKTVNLQTLCHPMNSKTGNALSTKGVTLLFIKTLSLWKEPAGRFNC